MKATKSVIQIQEYGRITVHLKEMLAQKGMTRNALAQATNTRFEVIDKWYGNQIERLDLDVLARICYVLDCSPAELIQYHVCEETS